MREKGGKGEKRKRGSTLLPKRNFINEGDKKGGSFTVLVWGAFIANPSYKIPKKTKSKNYYRGQNGKKTKK